MSGQRDRRIVFDSELPDLRCSTDCSPLPLGPGLSKHDRRTVHESDFVGDQEQTLECPIVWKTGAHDNDAHGSIIGVSSCVESLVVAARRRCYVLRRN
jgi:hypothetical protein